MAARRQQPSSSASATPTTMAPLLSLLLLLLSSITITIHADNPKSKPYVAYRTDPFDQPIVTTWVLKDGNEKSSSSTGRIHKNEVNRRNSNKENEEDTRCPLSFRLGSTHASHHLGGSGSSSSSGGAGAGSASGGGGSIARSPPVIYPLHPDLDAGSGRQILLATTWEMLEMWTPGGGGGGSSSSSIAGSGATSSSEQLKEDEQFPLLFEGSSFYHSAPIVYDVAGDGIMDAILGDYDGELHLIGLDFEQDNVATAGGRQKQGNNRNRRRRYYERISVPRLAVRKSWYDAAIGKTTVIGNATTVLSSDPNRTREDFIEPYHVIFELSNKDWRRAGEHSEGGEQQQPLRGVSADVLTMGMDSAKALSERRRQLQRGRRTLETGESEEEEKESSVDKAMHRRLQEVEEVGAREPDATRAEGERMDRGALDFVEGDMEYADAISDVPRDEAERMDGGPLDFVEGGMENADSISGSTRDEGERMDGGTLDFVEGGMVNVDATSEQVYPGDDGLFRDDATGAPPDGTESMEERGFARDWGDDVMMRNEGEEAMGTDEAGYRGADDYFPYGEHGYIDDGYRYKPQAPDGWDTYDQYQEAKDAFFHDSNYLHLPPHLLSTCTVVELPREYVSSSMKPADVIEELILCAVSYYFDEDEERAGMKRSFGKHANVHGGDETEEQRGRYVANAILGYNLKWKYWSLTEVLDLSTDWSSPLGDIVEGGTAGLNSDTHDGMGAWALATPIAVKLDGSVRNHIIVGTSMGLVYALEVGQHKIKSGWPVQLRHPVEQKVVVEDVVGNTNLEVFVVDTGGDVVSLNSDGVVLWSRSLLAEEETLPTKEVVYIVRGTSPMSLGDVEGTGGLAIVLLAKIAITDRHHINQPNKHELFEYRLYAIDAITGDDLPHFPIALAGGGSNMSHTSSLPQPLLIDLHEDQHHWLDRIRLSNEDASVIRAMNIDASRQYHTNDSSKPRPHGGSGRGLHIVQPLGSILHLIEGSTSCEQTIDVGDTIPSMVQADDVHGTGGLDLVVTTSQGEILTLESDVVPYHPLNVWSAGVSRAPGSGNAHAHGFSSTQGIFVHPISRQFRDVLGIYIPITFEIFDRRPSINEENDRRVYQVEIRAGQSAKRAVYWHVYDAPGVYTERIQIPYGPGYYSFAVRLRTTHGIVYEDSFHIGWNVNYMGGLWLIVCLPLILAAIPILMFRRNPNWQIDDDYGSGARGFGILGKAPPS